VNCYLNNNDNRDKTKKTAQTLDMTGLKGLFEVYRFRYISSCFCIENDTPNI